MPNKKWGHEIELKWAVRRPADAKKFLAAVRQSGARTGMPQKLRIHDRYLDTADRFFLGKKMKCRLRNQNGRWELTFKGVSTRKSGILFRREKNIPLPGFRSAKAALSHSFKKIRKEFPQCPELSILFELKNRRTCTALKFHPQTQAELCFDDVRFFCKKKKAFLKEIELEFKGGSVRAFESFAHRMTRETGLKRSKRSKVATALQWVPEHS